MDVLILLASFVIILLGAELFTNGIEWFGHKLELAEGAVGSVLAAVGTALPETTIPVVAILFASGEHTNDVGIGAILGAPFMLSTLALGITGVVVLTQAGRRSTGDVVRVDRTVLGADVQAFAIAYALAIGAAFLPVDAAWPKYVVAAVLVLLYGRYVKRHFDAEAGLDAEGLNPLRLHALDRGADPHPAPPRLRIVNVQVAVGIGLIIVGAIVFVDAVSGVAHRAGMNEVLLALIVAPIATELPEGFNAILWVRRGRDTLALANITGAMVFQASIATIVALLFAPTAWVFGPGTQLAFASAAIAFLSTAVILVPTIRGGSLRGRWLLLGGGFYVAYLIGVLVVVSSG